MNEPSPEDWRKVANDWIIVTNRILRVLGSPEQPLWKTPPTQGDILQWEQSNPEFFNKFKEQVYQEMKHRLSLKRKKNHYFWYFIFVHVIFILIYLFWSFV